MKRWTCWAALVGVALAGGFAAPVRGQDKKGEASEKEAKGALPPGRWEYRHTTDRGNAGVFVLDEKMGTGEFVFNGARRKEQLEYKRFAEVPDPRDRTTYRGWVYEVKGKGKDAEPIWFFFGATPIKNARGEAVYPMFYSVTPPTKDGKQVWVRILTRGGTARKELAGRPKPPPDDD
jgi:hypothetical protein